MGVRSPIPAHPFIGIGGGGSEGATPLDMASAYATIANDGLACPARSILEVRRRGGDRLDPPDEITVGLQQQARSRTWSEEELAGRPDELRAMDQGRCRQVIDPDIARATAQTLELVVSETTATRADIGRPQAGKTGTSDGPKDAWFTGFTPDLSLSVWVGDPDFDDDGVRELRGIEGFNRVFGGTLPALIWRDAASVMLEDVPPSDFLQPGELSPDGGRQPAPERSKPEPTPSESESASASDEPTTDPSSSDDPTVDPTIDPTPSGSESDDECIILINC